MTDTRDPTVSTYLLRLQNALAGSDAREVVTACTAIRAEHQRERPPDTPALFAELSPAMHRKLRGLANELVSPRHQKELDTLQKSSWAIEAYDFFSFFPTIQLCRAGLRSLGWLIRQERPPNCTFENVIMEMKVAALERQNKPGCCPSTTFDVLKPRDIEAACQAVIGMYDQSIVENRRVELSKAREIDNKRKRKDDAPEKGAELSEVGDGLFWKRPRLSTSATDPKQGFVEFISPLATCVSREMNVLGPIWESIPEDLRVALEKQKLPDLSRLPPDVREVWESAGGLPRLIPANQFCRKGKQHDSYDLFEKFMTARADSLRVFSNGYEVDRAERLRSIRWLAFHRLQPVSGEEGESVSAIYNFPPESGHMIVPLIGELVPVEVEPQDALWTMTGNLTDCHIDAGIDVASLTLDDSERLVIAFPGHQRNLASWEKIKDSAGRLLQALKHGLFEAGLTFDLTSSKGMYLPPSTIHAVFTTRGGMLLSCSFYTCRTIIPLSTWLRYDPPSDLKSEDARNALGSWITAAKAAQTSNSILQGWNIAESMLRCLLHEHSCLVEDLRNVLSTHITMAAATRNGKLEEQLTGIRATLELL